MSPSNKKKLNSREKNIIVLPFICEFRNGYARYQFNRPDLGSHGSYGGKLYPTETLKHDPVIFIHGNSDGALAIPGNYSSGWSNSIQYFLEQGYHSGELYATTWGDRDPENAKFR